jgi:5-methylcytosine-specific restriction endonuclease McrA
MTTKEEYQVYLQTDYWKAVSQEVKHRAGYKCQACNTPHDLEAHHRTYVNRGKEMEHLEDLICLCGVCHGRIHGVPEQQQPKKKKKRWKRFKKKKNKGYFTRVLKRGGWWEPKKIVAQPYDPNQCLDKSLIN